MPDWRIYYSDGTTFDSSMGDADKAPAFGTICIVQPDDIVGRIIMQGWDWYYFVPAENQWWGSDLTGILDRLLHRLPIVGLLQGRNISNKDFATILGMADTDPDFPPKSGKHRYESPRAEQSRRVALLRSIGLISQPGIRL